MVGGFNRFAHSAGPGVEKDVGRLLSYLRGKWAPWGLKNQRFWTSRGWNFASRGVPNGLPEASWGFLGARSATGGRSGWKRSKSIIATSKGRLGAHLARLGLPLGLLPPLPGGPGEALGARFLEVLCGSQAREPQQ